MTTFCRTIRNHGCFVSMFLWGFMFRSLEIVQLPLPSFAELCHTCPIDPIVLQDRQQVCSWDLLRSPEFPQLPLCHLFNHIDLMLGLLCHVMPPPRWQDGQADPLHFYQQCLGCLGPFGPSRTHFNICSLLYWLYATQGPLMITWTKSTAL